MTPVTPLHPLDELRHRIDMTKGFEFEDLCEPYLEAVCGATDIEPQDPDLGVDRFFKDSAGRRGAAQMKCYRPGNNVTMRDMTQFIEAARADGVFTNLHLLTTSELTVNAMGVARRHGVAIHYYEDLITVSCWDPKGPVVHPAPLDPSGRAYQVAAIAATLCPAERGQIIMPTGSGKSLVQAEAARSLDSVLVMVPNIGLIRQIAGTFRRQNPGRPILAVVSKSENDDYGSPVEATTRPAVLQKFLDETDRPIVLATYQSSQAVVNGSFGFVYDAVFYDESHRTAGVNAKTANPLFKRTLTGVSARQRRYFTATPRIHAEEVKLAVASKGLLSYSMDDVSVYGERLHETTLQELQEQGYLAPLHIVVALMTRADVAAEIAANGWTDYYNPSDLDSVQNLASVVFVLNAAEELDLKRVLAFHRTVKRSEKIRDLVETVAGDLRRKVTVKAVDAKSSRAQRNKAIKMLREAAGGLNVVCNVRLFGEGMDAPALDAVAYFDPKSSPIAITQSIGRAVRIDPKNPDKVAYLLVPVFVDDAADGKTALEQGAFAPIQAVHSALVDLGLTIQQVDRTVSDAGMGPAKASAYTVIDIKIPGSWDAAATGSGIRSLLLTGRWDAYATAKASLLAAGKYVAFVKAIKAAYDLSAMDHEERAAVMEAEALKAAAAL